MARRGKPGVPPKAAKVIREVLDDIDMPKPRKRGGRGGGGGGGTPRPHSNPDAPVPSHYRQVPYGSTHESQLVQQARLGPPRDRGGTYSAASWTDANGTVHHGIGKSDANGHAESRALDELRAKIAQAEGHGDPSRVSLDRDGVKLYVEYSPCDTKPRFCQQQIADQAPRADVSYSHPWQPRSVRDTSREGLKNDIAALFERGTVGPL